MGRVSKRDQKMFTQLIKDCVLYGLNENESIAYIEKRTGGRKISRSKLYVMKKKISKDQERTAQEMLTHHKRIGFVLKHLELEYTIDVVQKNMMRLFLDQFTQGTDSINVFALCRTATNILESSKMLRRA